MPSFQAFPSASMFRGWKTHCIKGVRGAMGSHSYRRMEEQVETIRGTGYMGYVCYTWYRLYGFPKFRSENLNKMAPILATKNHYEKLPTTKRNILEFWTLKSYILCYTLTTKKSDAKKSFSSAYGFTAACIVVCRTVASVQQRGLRAAGRVPGGGRRGGGAPEQALGLHAPPALGR